MEPSPEPVLKRLTWGDVALLLSVALEQPGVVTRVWPTGVMLAVDLTQTRCQ